MRAIIDIWAGYESLDIAKLTAAAEREDGGALAVFAGYVRGGEVRAMTLEYYPAMTQRALESIAKEAAERWPLHAARIYHRAGRLVPGDAIVFVAASSPHRGEAFAACEFMVDYLKTRAPFWKKEETAQGERWVESKPDDEAARGKWG